MTFSRATVDVRITVDGKNKDVSSEMYHIGAKSGSQPNSSQPPRQLIKLLEQTDEMLLLTAGVTALYGRHTYRQLDD
jgi:hypothetical protein